MKTKVDKADSLVFVIVKQRFPFLCVCLEKDKTLYDDIKQIGWLAFYATNGDFKSFWNYCQRELYALAKSLGFRRTRKNEWRKKEVEIK